MSDQGSVPLPGVEPPGPARPPQPYGAPPPAYAQQPPPGWQPLPRQQPPGQQRPGQPPGRPGPGPGTLGAAHRPGAVPLRPLGLGDMLDGAFRIIRFNPRATVGAALLVAVVAMTLSLVVTASGVPIVDPVTGRLDGEPSAGSLAPALAGPLLLQLGLLLVTGLVAQVTHEAAAGRRIGLGEAWAMTHGRRWRLVGLVLLVGLASVVWFGLWVSSIALLVVAGTGTASTVLWGVLSGLVVLPVWMYVYVRLVLLATPALMLEDVGVLGALARSWRLSRRQFWRLFGISLLTGIVVAVAGFVVGLPVNLGTQVLAFTTPEHAVLLVVVGQALATVVSTAFTSPFSAVMATLQYLDQRMRKEAYDVTLMSRAGITGA